jgi:streptogramin lyase
VNQLEGFAAQTVQTTISGGQSVAIDFVMGDVKPEPNYVGGVPYPNAKIEPYSQVYPPGRGRDIIERTCLGCHTVNFFPYNVARTYSGGRPKKDKAAWTVTVDNMHRKPAFGRAGKASMFDPALLPPSDRAILIDYLDHNFGVDSVPRVVQLEKAAPIDSKALAKAMFVEYLFPNTAQYERWTHQIDFDKDGNVWVADTGCCIVRLDPRTGESRDFEGHGGGHGIAVDQTDGTVWYSGDVVRHLDPATGLVDHWKIGNDPLLGSNTQIFDSKGNLWLSLLAAGDLAKWDRQKNTIVYWDVPVLRSRPYGIIVDHSDKVWFADYHNGGVTRFDPDTEQFRHFKLTSAPTASSIRRLGVDADNNIWAPTFGSRGMRDEALYRLDPKNGKVSEFKLHMPFSAPYSAEADSAGNIWVPLDNFLTKFDVRTKSFTHYPLPTRSDSLKTTITRDDALWFIYRNAGHYGQYGGSAVVLYPDMDKIKTLAAYHSPDSPHNFSSKYRGQAAPKVQGGEHVVPLGSRNAVDYAVWARAQGLINEGAAGAPSALQSDKTRE